MVMKYRPAAMARSIVETKMIVKARIALLVFVRI
jgi:hypothetical protein